MKQLLLAATLGLTTLTANAVCPTALMVSILAQDNILNRQLLTIYQLLAILNII